MNLFNKKVSLLLLICFALVSMNAQQSDNNDQPVNTADAKKNTYKADPANSDNGDVAPAGHVSKNTYVADPAKSDNNDGVKEVKASKADASKKAAKNEYAADEAARAQTESAPRMRYDGKQDSQPQVRAKKEPVVDDGLEYNRDGTVRKSGDPVEPKRVREKKAKVVQPVTENANRDGSVKVKKENN